jgi:Uma2 family endonuclease
MLVLDDPGVKRHLLTCEQYHLMGEAGVFAPDARVELIEGEVIEMAPMGTRHFAVVSRLTRLLTAAVGEGAIVNSQLPIRLGSMSEPEPDLSILRPRDDFYASALPTGSETLLVIEVSDSTLAFDLRTKARLYARYGVPVYWVLDLRTSVLRVFAEPREGVYTSTSEHTAPGMVALPGLDGISVDLTGVL